MKLATDLLLTIPPHALLRTTFAAATFHNQGLCITTLSGQSVGMNEWQQCAVNLT